MRTKICVCIVSIGSKRFTARWLSRGNTLSTEQVTAVLEGKPVVAPINEVQEVRNALKAYELLDTLDPCKVDDLLEGSRHDGSGIDRRNRLFPQRRCGCGVGENGYPLCARCRTCAVSRKRSVQWLRTTDEHPLIASCVFHYEFEFYPSVRGR